MMMAMWPISSQARTSLYAIPTYLYKLKMRSPTETLAEQLLYTNVTKSANDWLFNTKLTRV